MTDRDGSFTPAQAAAERVVVHYDPPSRGPLRAVLAALARHVVTALGAALVARGLIDRDTAALAVGPVAEELVGAVLICIASAGAAARAHLSHSRWADAWRVLWGQATVHQPEITS